MCKAMEEMRNEAMAQGVAQGIAQERYKALKNMIKKLNLTLDEAFDVVDIADGEKEQYRQMFEQ